DFPSGGFGGVCGGAGMSEVGVELGRRSTGLDDPYWQRTDEEMELAALDWSHPVLAGIDMASLRKTGFARLQVGTPENFVPHREGNFPTPSGKCELKSSIA